VFLDYHMQRREHLGYLDLLQEGMVVRLLSMLTTESIRALLDDYEGTDI
jgi:hypothetical protein